MLSTSKYMHIFLCFGLQTNLLYVATNEVIFVCIEIEGSFHIFNPYYIAASFSQGPEITLCRIDKVNSFKNRVVFKPIRNFIAINQGSPSKIG